MSTEREDNDAGEEFAIENANFIILYGDKGEQDIRMDMNCSTHSLYGVALAALQMIDNHPDPFSGDAERAKAVSDAIKALEYCVVHQVEIGLAS